MRWPDSLFLERHPSRGSVVRAHGGSALLPALLALALAAFALLVLTSLPAAAADQALREEALEMVNEDRSAERLEPLRHDATLDAAARRHAEDMLRQGYFAHESPEGRTVMDRFRAEGGSAGLVVGENIGRCGGCAPPATADQIRNLHEGWMESPGHRRNILSADFNRFGFGVALGDDGLYAVQTFAGAGAPRSRAGGSAARPISDAEAAELALAALNEAREAEGAQPLIHSPPLSEAADRALSEASATGELALANVPTAGLLERIPRSDRQGWTSLSTLAGECGGCGEIVTDADVEYFIAEWLSNPGYGGTLLDGAARVLGFALAADGEGRKVAIALVASR